MGIDPSYQPVYYVHNPTQWIKHPRITKMVNQVAGLKRAIGIKTQFGIANKVHRANTTVRLPNQLNKSIRMKMAAFFQEDIKLLSQLIGKDLSTWSSVQ